MSKSTISSRDLEGSNPEEGLLLGVPSTPPRPASSASSAYDLSKKFSSFASLSTFKDGGELFLQSSAKRCHGVLMQGPRRFLRLCIFGFIIPVLLISIPLYVRLILYPPIHYSMAPTDQRPINQRSSSVWCQGQSIRMNGSFNAFLMDGPPVTKKKFSTHTMMRHLTLKDDVKEYWGFFLQKGSIVTFNLCTRYDGGILMIMRGVTNLRKCAWVGEEDSAEQDEDHMEASNESGEPPQVYHEVLENGTEEGMAGGFLTKERLSQSSAEKQRDLDYYVQKILRLGKDRQEIMQLLSKQEFPAKTNTNQAEETPSKDSISAKVTTAAGVKGAGEGSRQAVPGMKNEWSSLKGGEDDSPHSQEGKLERVKRTLNEEDTTDDQGGEFDIVNDIDIYQEEANHFRQNSSMEMSPLVRETYLSLFHLPSGLTYERGKFNQTHNHDTSNEEERSSFSSSEEALTKCSGLQGLIPLFQNRKCHSFNDTRKNRITYKIPHTGTYYFVFSSDNEVFDSEIYINMTLQKVVFDTQNATKSCHNETSCSMGFSFWSHDQAIVEVPEGDWDSAYTLEVICKPRATVYLAILIFVPIMFLFCALQ